jgi:hypothetical protein
MRDYHLQRLGNVFLIFYAYSFSGNRCGYYARVKKRRSGLAEEVREQDLTIFLLRN